jgi:SpoVK/Ycf46/Vps4 family AAA+-type ATPase
MLEYYSGILIMTTARVGTLDEAFKSRIHIVLYFPPLNEVMYLKIWEIALHRLRDEKNIKVTMRQVMHFVKEDWVRSKDRQMNGRDIQNAVQSAVALAEFEARREGGEAILTYHHFEPVLRMSDDFDKVMWLPFHKYLGTKLWLVWLHDLFHFKANINLPNTFWICQNSC